MAKDLKPPEMVDANRLGMMDDNMFHQIQKLFGFLELTDRQFCNPKKYCYSFKDYSGKPVNLTEQQDAQEYLNRFLDKIEKALKPTPFRNIVHNIYGGKTCTVITCLNKECRAVRKRE